MQFETKIVAIKAGDFPEVTNFVKQVDFVVEGTEGELSFQIPNSVTFEDPKPGEAYTPYNTLKKQDVVAWVESSPIYQPVKSHVEMVLKDMIVKAQFKPKELPW
jgi:hypothetical protein